jgi:hypothetical protein
MDRSAGSVGPQVGFRVFGLPVRQPEADEV